MTVFPPPKIFALEESRNSALFSVDDVKKNLEKEFATPLCNSSIIEKADYMKVFVRLRPLFSKETNINKDKAQNCMRISEEDRVLILNAPKDSHKFRAVSRGMGEAVHRYAFSKVFQPEVSQKDFFDATALEIVENFVKGQNALIFTYGVTSSGKTYTMQGLPGNEGIIPRSIDVIFNSIGEHIATDTSIKLHLANSVVMLNEEEKSRLNQRKNLVLALANEVELPHDLTSKSGSSLGTTLESSSLDGTITESGKRRSSFLDFAARIADDSVVDVSFQGSAKYAAFVSFIEVYNDQIYDLLQFMGKVSKRSSLKLAEDKSRPFVKNLQEIQVNSREEVFKLLAVGKKNLHTAETRLNHNSSRSHCIFTIKLACIRDGVSPTRARICQLSFCDLAGSERSKKTKSIGPRLTEAQNINSSLLSLGKCITVLRYNQQHKAGNQRVVPFRESKLTRLFQSILQGDGKACMIVNVNQDPSFFDETLHVLEFSAVASEIKNLPKPRRRSSKCDGGKRKSSFDGYRHSKRFTIGWEPKQTPIKEQEECGSDVEEYSSDEDDKEYWENRERELLDQIERLQQSISELERKLVSEREYHAKSVKELNAATKQMMDETNENAEKRMKKIEEYGEEKYLDTVKLANKKIDCILEQKRSAEERAQELDQECNELLEKLNFYEDRYDEDKPLHDQIEDLERHLDEKDTNLKAFQNENKSLKEEISELRKAFNDEDGKLSEENESELKTLKKENDSLTEELKKLRSSSIEPDREEYVQSLLEENESGREIIKEQLAQLEELERESKRSETKYLSEMKEMKNELAKISNLHEDREKALKTKLASVEEQLQKKLNKVENAEQELEEVRSKLKQSEIQLEAVAADKAILQQRKCTSDDERQKYEQSIENFKSEVEKLEIELHTVKDENEILREQNLTYNTERKEIEKNVEDFKSKLESLEEELKKAAFENEVQQKQISTFYEEKKDHETKANDFKSTVDGLEHELQDVKAKKNSLEQTVDEMASYKDMFDKLQLKMEDSKQKKIARITTLEKEKSEILRELEECKSLVEDLKSKVEGFERDVKDKDTLITTSETEKCRLSKALSDNKSWIVNLKSIIEGLEQDFKKASSKNKELSSTLEEAIVCGEMKSAEVIELTKKNNVLIGRVSELESQLQRVESENAVLKSDRDSVEAALETKINQIKVKHERELEYESQEAAKNCDEIKKQNRKDRRKLENELLKATDEVEELKKEVELGKRIEEGMKAEVNKLEIALSKVKSEKATLEEKVDVKPPKSVLAELQKDVKLLEMERNDLMSNAERLKTENIDLKKENKELKENEPSISVDIASEMEKMKGAMEEMDKLQEKQQTIITELEKRKSANEEMLEESRRNIKALLEENQNLKRDYKKMKATSDDSIAAQKKFFGEAEESKAQLNNCKEELLQEKNLRQKLDAQVHQLQTKITSLKDEVKAKEEDLKKFRDARDKISSALERKINTINACNDELKKKLEDQIETNVKLRSENSKLRAESALSIPTNYALKKEAAARDTIVLVTPMKKECISPLKQNKEAAARDTIVLVTPLKKECISPLKQNEEDVISHVSSTAPIHSPMVEMINQSTDVVETPTDEKPDSEETGSAEERRQSKRVTQGRSRGSTRRAAVKKSTSRRKRTGAVRHPTPIPELRSSFDEDSVDVSPVKTRRVLRSKKASSVSLKAEPSDETETDQDATLTNEVPDEPVSRDEIVEKVDPKSSRFTEHEDDFPKPELEIDVTPVVKKSKRRKRAIKQQDDDVENSENMETNEVARSRSRRRGRKAEESSTCDEEDTVLKPKTMNMSRMGDIIKNSPVGQALKKIESAMSPRPHISAPTTAFYCHDPKRTSRRTRKLHAEDISLPLQTTPDESDVIGAVGRGVGLLPQVESDIAGSTIKKRLRRRK